MTSLTENPTNFTTQEQSPYQKPHSKISKSDLLKAFYIQRSAHPALQPLLETLPEIFSPIPLEPESIQPQQNPNWSDMIVEASTPVRPMRLVPQKRTYIPNSPFTTSGYVEDPTARVWYYLDEGNSVQGPFTSLEMDHWYDSRFFFNELLIRIHERNDFVKLIHLFGKTEIIHVYKPMPFGNMEGGGIYSGVASPNGPLGSTGPLSSAKSGKGSMYTFGYNSDITFGNNSEADRPSEGTVSQTMSQEPTPQRTPGRSPSKAKAFTYDFMNTNMDVIQETCPQSEVGKPDSAEKKVHEPRKSKEEEKLQPFVVQNIETKLEEKQIVKEVMPEVKVEVKEEINSPELPKDQRFEDISTDNISNDVQPNSQEKVDVKCPDFSVEESGKKSKSTTPKNRSINEGRDSGNEAGSRRGSNHARKPSKYDEGEYKRHGEGWKEDGVQENNAGKSKYNNNNNRRKNFDEVVYYEKKSVCNKAENINYDIKQSNKDYGYVDNKYDEYQKNDKYFKKGAQKTWSEESPHDYKNNKKGNNYNRDDNNSHNNYTSNSGYNNKQKRGSEETHIVEYREKDNQNRINRPNKAKGLVLHKKDDRFLDDQYERGNDNQGYNNNYNQQQGGHHQRKKSNNFSLKQDKNIHTPGKQTKDHRDGKSNNNYNESGKKVYNAKGENQIQEMTIFVPKKKEIKDDVHTGVNGNSLNSTSASTNPEENKGYEKKNKKWNNKRQSEDNVKYQEKKKVVNYERRDSETFEMLKATSEFYSNEMERATEFYDEGFLDWASPGKQTRKSSEPQPQENIGPVKMWEKPSKEKISPAKKKIMDYEMDQDDIVSSSLGLLDLEGEGTIGRNRGPSYFKNTSAHPSPNRLDKGLPLFNFTEDYIRFE